MSVLKSIFLVISFICLISCMDNAQSKDQPHDLLNSVLWMQNAAEYKACCYQTYNTARIMMIKGLNEKNWTAAAEQESQYEHLPPAVILDIDETVLDNTPYEAGIIDRNATYSSDSWKQWCEERRALAISGAVDFCEYAAQNNIKVLFVTNRRQSEFDATKYNLISAGFPAPIDSTTLFPRTTQSDKTARRKYLAKKYRILLLIGDNAGDFHGGYTKAESARRDSLVHAHQAYWGLKWIVLPNPAYGDWEGALYNYNHELTDSQKRIEKKKKLRF